MIVTKLDAARRQLQTAIELWVDDRDPVSIHTLAYAAYQVIHDLNRHAKGAPLLLDSAYIRPEMKQEFVNRVKSDAVFFKHADDRQKGKKNKNAPKPSLSIDFEPDVNEHFFAFAILGLGQLQQDFTAHEIAFRAWYAIQHPHLLTEEAMSLQKNTLSDEQVASIRGMKKKQFFEAFLKLPRVV
jgi:hypothetical protein